ncbi:MAG: aa3-type cytochrome c oxidase subunit IV [Alphaproteobacteria bacterium]|nr:aa3-type cytochrome c oxidase subunit IV [Alphaproteobacteria bacterium]
MENFEDSVRRHRASWDAFSHLMLYSTVSVLVVLALMAIFLL